MTHILSPALPGNDASTSGIYSHHFQVMWVHWEWHPILPRSCTSPEPQSLNFTCSSFVGRKGWGNRIHELKLVSLNCPKSSLDFVSVPIPRKHPIRESSQGTKKERRQSSRWKKVAIMCVYQIIQIRRKSLGIGSKLFYTHTHTYAHTLYSLLHCIFNKEIKKLQ